MVHRSESILTKDFSVISSNKLLDYSKVLTKTGFGFVMENAEKTLDDNYQDGLIIYAKANKYFERAVHLGNKYFRNKYPNFNNWLEGSKNSNIKFISYDVEPLYWLAAAYGGAVSSSRGNPQWIIHLPKVGLLIEKALELDPDWNYGALYSMMITYSMTLSDTPTKDWDASGSIGGYNRFGVKSDNNGHYNNKGVRESEYIGVKVATKYYNKALEASKRMDLSSHVSYAENVLVFQQNRSEFIRLLNVVIESKRQEIKDLELGNLMAKKRAQWLLGRTEELFF